MRGFSTAILQLISAIALVLGIAYFVSATTTPGSYRLGDASAIQVSQVYSEALYYAALSIASFLFGIFIQLALYFGNYYDQPKLESIEDETIAIRNTLNKVGRMLQQQSTDTSIAKPNNDKTGMRTLLNRDEPEF